MGSNGDDRGSPPSQGDLAGHMRNLIVLDLGVAAWPMLSSALYK
jgi:hypothetical protein